MNKILSRLTVRSVVVIILVVGAFVLAIADHSFRPTFGDLAKIGVGGYLGQMLPESVKRSGDSFKVPNSGIRGRSYMKSVLAREKPLQCNNS